MHDARRTAATCPNKRPRDLGAHELGARELRAHELESRQDNKRLRDLEHLEPHELRARELRAHELEHQEHRHLELDGLPASQTSIPALCERAQYLYEEARDYDGAEALYKRVLTLQPSHVETLCNYALLLETTQVT